MKLLLVSGPWGSGTTAVAGMLERLGALGFGPYFQSDDTRTPNTFEFLPFRQLLRKYITISSLTYREDRLAELEADLRELSSQIEAQAFGPYDPAAGIPIFLKCPASALVLPQICGVFDTKIISVMRPLAQIEQTRLRRNWPLVFGKSGAEILYRHLAKAINARMCPYMRVNYSEAVNSPHLLANRLVEFAPLNADARRIEMAAAFIKRGGSSIFSDAARNAGRPRE